jgi:hypothetical protein
LLVAPLTWTTGSLRTYELFMLFKVAIEFSVFLSNASNISA